VDSGPRYQSPGVLLVYGVGGPKGAGDIGAAKRKKQTPATSEARSAAAELRFEGAS